MQSRDILKVPEVAAMFRVSNMTVYRMIHDGELPHVRIGRSFRVSRAAAEAFLAKLGLEPESRPADDATGEHASSA